MKKGEWVPVWSRDGRHSTIAKCSKCDHHALGDPITGLNLITPYCPFCGAKMQNKKEPYFNK